MKKLPLCPSAQPNMENSVVFGVIGGTAEEPRTIFLNEAQPVSEVEKLSGPVKPTEVFRIAANCAEHQCMHFDGAKCRLVQKVASLDPAIDSLVPCPIRTECRWWQEEGKDACLRCPFVVTEHYSPSKELKAAADPGH
jgi:hypothetical protein